MISAHPLKEVAASLLEAQLRMPDSPSRAEILADVKRQLEARRDPAGANVGG